MNTTKLQIGKRHAERGQVTIMVLVALAIFLLAFVGVATDATNWWFQRQAVQSTADATCQAAAVDLYLVATGEPTGLANFTPTLNGTIDCGGALTASPCIIAKYNGYDPAVSANQVVMSFPQTIAGAPAPPDDVAVPYVQVDVTTQAPAYFTTLLTGQRTVNVHAKAACGLVNAPGPVPIVVLHPSDPATINMNGASDTIAIVGGPQQSIQVNSTDANAVSSGSLATVDLSQGGPDTTGSSFGTFGGTANAPGSVLLGSTGEWLYPHSPISDPYRTVAAPAKPGVPAGTPFSVILGQDGCPDPAGCDEFKPGFYSGGICVKGGGGCPKNSSSGSHATAVFQPGLYYVGGVGLELDSNSTARVTCCGGTNSDGDGTGGVMFYFSDSKGTASINVNSNSGSQPTCTTNVNPKNCIVKYHVNGASETGTLNGVAYTVQSRALQCPGGAAPPSELPATIAGNVLLAPCSGTYSDPLDQNRGFLFFQDRGVAVGSPNGNGVPEWNGGGSTLIAGYMYFHNCRKGDNSGNYPCDNSAFGDIFSLGGNSGSTSYAVGSLITDKIYSHGTPGLVMILNPYKEFPLLKIAFFQ